MMVRVKYLEQREYDTMTHTNHLISEDVYPVFKSWVLLFVLSFFRTTCTKDAADLVHLFGWEKYVSYKEIYPGCKLKHFER